MFRHCEITSTFILGIALCFPINNAIAQNSTAEIVREVSVTSSARSWAPANELQVSVRLEESGTKAELLLGEIDGLAKKITAAVKSIDPDINILQRGTSIENAANKTASLTNSNTLRVSRFLGFHTKKLDLAGKIIDTAISQGAKDVVEVEYFAPHDSQQHLTAVEEATKRAQLKAEKAAKSLNVILGSVLSTTISEEPVGGMLRKRMQAGALAGPYNEYNTTIYVTIRFELETKS